MAVVTTILPEITKRMTIDATIVITFDTQLNAASIDVGNMLFLDSDGSAIPFSVSNSPTTYDITLTPNALLDYDNIYTVTLTSSILDVGFSPITPKTFKFLTKIEGDLPSVDLSIDGNPNDVFYKGLLIPDLLNIRHILETGDQFNFQYTPSFKDEITGKYFTSSVRKINFDNKEFIEKQFRSQYLSSFDLYFDNITTLSTTDQTSLKKSLYNQSYALNTSSGLVRKIKYLLEIYGKMLGYNFVDVEPDPVDVFVYHISTNIPNEHWKRFLKSLLHPVGWEERYTTVTDPTLPYYQTENYDWTDEYLLNDFRTKFYVLGQNKAILVPSITSTDPPIADPIDSISGDYTTTQIPNWASETTQRILLSVLQNIRPKNKWVFSYLEAGTLGSIFDTSRLTFDAAGSLQLVVVPGSPITTFFDVGADTVFKYLDESNPVLYVEGDDFMPNEFEFGNVELENDVVEIVEVNGDIFDIFDITAPANGIQTITFSEPINGDSPGSGIIETTNKLITTGFSNGTNNGTFFVLTHDYVTDSVTISNVAGVAETPSPATASAERQIPIHHDVTTFILPNVFSNDFQLWNGYTYYFNQNKIDPSDYEDFEEFDYKYAEWNASVNYPKEGTGDGTYDAFVIDLTDPDNFSDKTAKCLAKRYLMTTPNVTWEQGNKVYEFIDETGSTGYADSYGVYHGFVEKYDSSTDEIIVKFLNSEISAAAFDTGGTFTDYTSVTASYPSPESPFTGADDVPLLASAPIVNDAFYFGFNQEFSEMTIDISTAGVGAWVLTWEYSQGSDTWATVAVTDETDSFRNLGFGNVSFTPPVDWASDTIDSAGVNLTGYFIRTRVSTAVTGTQPFANNVWINTGFHPDKYYSNVQVEKELLTSVTDTSTEFGTYSELYNRKITLGYVWADFDSYLWEYYPTGGLSDGEVERTEFNNSMVLMGQPGVIYDVDLTIGLSRKEISTVTTFPDVAGDLHSTYFTLNSGGDATSYYVWYNVSGASGGGDPTPSGLLQGVQVDIALNESADVIAQLTKQALESTVLSPYAPGDDFTVSFENDIITITNKTNDDATDTLDATASGFETGFTFSTTSQGKDNFELLHPLGQSETTTWFDL